MSAETELTTYLANGGVGTSGTTLFYGLEFKEFYPDACTLIRHYPGLATEPNMGDGSTSGKAARIENPSFQICTRGVRDDYDGPQTINQLAYSLMLAILNSPLSVGGTYYLAADAIQKPFPLTRDENWRYYFAFNVHLMKEPS